MKPHLQCGEQQVSRSNLTKYCACHAGRLTDLVLITYETSFTMRGATGVTIQPHQILRLSRRKTRILSQSSSHMKPHLQCAEQQVSRSNLTKYCACHAERLTYLVLIIIYSARSNRCHDPTSPNTAPVTQKDSHT